MLEALQVFEEDQLTLQKGFNGATTNRKHESRYRYIMQRIMRLPRDAMDGRVPGFCGLRKHFSRPSFANILCTAQYVEIHIVLVCAKSPSMASKMS